MTNVNPECKVEDKETIKIVIMIEDTETIIHVYSKYSLSKRPQCLGICINDHLDRRK